MEPVQTITVGPLQTIVLNHELRFLPRSPSAAQQLARGSKPLRGKFPAYAVARAAEPPAVDLSSPTGHLLEAIKPRGERRAAAQRAAGPRNDSGDHIRDKSLQSTTVNPATESEMSRQTPCKPPRSNRRWRSLHTREVAGSKPAVPITGSLTNCDRSWRPGFARICRGVRGTGGAQPRTRRVASHP